MKHIAFLPFLACAPGAAGAPIVGAGITMPLASSASAERPIGAALLLRVAGNATDGFEVEVTSRTALRGCQPNLVHWSPHGPDPSEVLAWQVTAARFPDTRRVPVCGHDLIVEIALVAPAISPDGARFTSGTLVVSVEHRDQGSPMPAPGRSSGP